MYIQEGIPPITSLVHLNMNRNQQHSTNEAVNQKSWATYTSQVLIQNFPRRVALSIINLYWCKGGGGWQLVNNGGLFYTTLHSHPGSSWYTYLQVEEREGSSCYQTPRRTSDTPSAVHRKSLLRSEHLSPVFLISLVGWAEPCEKL